MSSAVVTPFPWPRTPRFSRRELRARSELRRRLGRAFDELELAAALRDVLGEGARAGGVVFGAPAREQPPATAIHLRLPAHGLWLSLEPEAELVRASVARLLAEDFELGWADAGVDPPLAGAFAALALELARRAARSEAPEFVYGEVIADPAGAVLAGGATVWLGEKPYRVGFQLFSCGESSSSNAAHPRPPRLRALGDVRLRVPWVSALSTATPELLRALGCGDVWLPGAGAWLAESATAGGVLAPVRATRGMPIRVSSGRIVLGAKPVVLHEEPESNVSREESELEQIVAETPVVVRLEIGALELTASEWASLRPGDVVQSGRRIEEGVILRAGGREIARGELVDIEGEVGVRITEVGAVRDPA